MYSLLVFFFVIPIVIINGYKCLNLFGIYVLLNCYALILHSNGYKALSILYNNNHLLCWLILDT